jgi:hypothetical protein
MEMIRWANKIVPKILPFNSHIFFALPRGLFPSKLQTKFLFAFTVIMRSVCPTHLILLGSITPIIFG